MGEEWNMNQPGDADARFGTPGTAQHAAQDESTATSPDALREPEGETSGSETLRPSPEDNGRAASEAAEAAMGAPPTTAEFLPHLDRWGRQVLAANQASVEALKRDQDVLAAKLRDLSDKLDEVTYSFSEPRIRDLLSSLLLLHDLAEQMATSVGDSPDDAKHRRNYGTLLSQILQLLRVNGIEVIPTDGAFDENNHNALDVLPTDDPAEDGQISRVFRKGFRSSLRPLRYADVQVRTMRPSGSQPPTGEEGPPETTQ
jgi:molecular chaperone GrpE (heat shock protein)